MSYNRKLSRAAFGTTVVLDIALAHWLVWLSTEGQKTQGLWFKFGSIWGMIMLILTMVAGFWAVEES